MNEGQGERLTPGEGDWGEGMVLNYERSFARSGIRCQARSFRSITITYCKYKIEKNPIIVYCSNVYTSRLTPS